METYTNTKLIKNNAISQVEEYGHIYKEWHPTLNFALNPDTVGAKSAKSAWWQCSVNPQHVWDMSIAARTVQEQKCPMCSGKRIDTGRNDLATMNSGVAAEWDFDANNQEDHLTGLNPSNIAAGSNKKAHWIGSECGHKWEAIIQSRTKGANTCPYCSNRKVLAGFNDLGSRADLSHIVAEWHEDNIVTPQEVSASANKKVKWQCSRDSSHSWEAVIANRTTKGSGCPHCYRAGNTAKKPTTLLKDDPILSKEYHTELNTEPIDNIVVGSAKTVWWKCSKDERHEWEAQVNNRTRNGSGCLVCAGKKVVPGINDLASDPEYTHLVKEWHEDNKLNPTEVLAGSSVNYKWKCVKNHEWEASIYTRMRSKQNCPICAGRTGDDILTIDQIPELMKEWHKDNTLDPSEVSSRGAKLIKWQCQKDSRHVWDAAANQRTVRKNNCPVCTGLKIIPGVNDLSSYAQYSHLLPEWHKDNTIQPTEVSYASNKLVKWQCAIKKSHVWTTAVYARTRGDGCPGCAAERTVSKAEQEIADMLMSLGLTVEQSVKSLLLGREIDIYLPDYKFAIEFNGLYWHSSKFRPDPNYHYKKWNDCQIQGIRLYQIWEDDWKRKKEIVIRSILSSLSMTHRIKEVLPAIDDSYSEIVGASVLKVRTLKHQEAQVFFDNNHLKGFALGSHYVGLLDDKNVVRAAVILTPGDSAEQYIISRYAAAGEVVGGLEKLLSSRVLKKIVESNKIYGIIALDTDNIKSNFLADNGFVLDKLVPPTMFFTKSDKRYPADHFTVESFQKDKGLVYYAGNSVIELAKLNGYDNVYDSGQYLYSR